MVEKSLDPWQFRISGTAGPNAVQVGELSLEVGPDIGVIRLCDQQGVSVGVLLGFPIDLDTGTLLPASGNHHVAYKLGTDSDEFAEKVIASLSGRFLFIFNTDDVSRVYLDCSAQVPCVYDPVMKIAASTSHAMFDEESYWERFDQDLYDKLGVVREGWFPGGLTAHRGVERVLPNHYLDLHTWTVKRHWPRSEIATCQNPMDIVEEVVALIHTQLSALSRGPKNIAQALTAGRETRMLLACARPVVEQTLFATVAGPDRHECDTRMARRIARDLGLQHREVSRVEASQSQRDLFVRRGGHCVGDTNALYHPSVWPLAEKFVLVGGLGGEIGRAFLWQNSDTPDMPVSTDRIIGRLGLPKLDALTGRIDAWLDDLPPGDAFSILDLAYIEQRMGPWYGVQFFCDPTLVRTAPLMTRRAVELMLSLPADWKRSSRLYDEIIQQNWPELGGYPYNSLGIWKDGINKARKAIKNPRIIVKKLRKLSQ